MCLAIPMQVAHVGYAIQKIFPADALLAPATAAATAGQS